MQYTEFIFSIYPCEEFIKDILASELAEVGFESFEQTDEELKAYILSNNLNKEAFDLIFNAFTSEYSNFRIEYTINNIAPANWNEEWEKHYFKPIIIGDKCVIHSSFHENIPKAEFDILIDPKMAFGTGHHETTFLMLSSMLDVELNNKSMLDMGCGTAVLAILAAMKGANPVVAIDIDEWAYNNSLENIKLNNVNSIDIKLGGAEILGNDAYDYIFANINRNILLNDMQHYVHCLNKNGFLYMSGFYVEDIPVIREKAESLGLTFSGYLEKNNWVAVKFHL